MTSTFQHPDELALLASRRQWLGRSAAGIGATALASVINEDLFSTKSAAAPHFQPAAKRVIYLFQSGAPSQFELFDRKPTLDRLHGTVLPPTFFQGQRQTGMTAGQEKRVCRSIYSFARHGDSGAELSELLPHLGRSADDLCILRSVQTDAINHDPAITFFQTGFQQPGRPSMGSWVSYGLGSDNANLPAYVVMISQGSAKRDSQALYARLWGSGLLPSAHQGVKFRAQGDAVLYLNNPPGITQRRRRRMLDLTQSLNHIQYQHDRDPETLTRIRQAELAYRMQVSVPELVDLRNEPQHILKLYGESARRPGSYAANCLLARRLAERGVRFIQLYHRGWDQHGGLIGALPKQCNDTDQACAALVTDLKQRGMLDETLVVWGGEFGRTTYSQGGAGKAANGRDHHPRCFTYWMAGGGIKGGMTYGETDPFGYNIVKDPVHVHDWQATVMQLMGIDHERLTFRHQGRRFRLTDVHGKVVKPILA